MAELEDLRGAEWSDRAKDSIQRLLVNLRDRWEYMDANERQLALGAAYALWRSTMMMSLDDWEQLLRPAEDDALTLLNAVIDGDSQSSLDVHVRRWSGGYYINNADLRVTAIQLGPAKTRSFDRGCTLRQAWILTFRELNEIVDRVPDPHQSPTVTLSKKQLQI